MTSIFNKIISKNIIPANIITVKNFTAALACLVLSACVTQSTVTGQSTTPPAWVNSEPDMYPNAKYLSATGSASKAETAKNRALSNLSKIFEVRVREVSTARSDVESHREEGIETVKKSQRLNSTVNVQTDKMIKGARIAEQWQSASDLTYYALAVLDRTQAGNNIKQQMSALDEDTEFALKQAANRASEKDSLLLKISDIHAANQLQTNREVLQKTLKIIDVRGKGAPPSWSLVELGEQLNIAIRELPITTVVIEDSVGGLDNMLQAATSQAGFVVDTDSGHSVYQIAASMKTQPAFESEGWFWLRGNLKLELVSDDAQTIMGYKSWPLKVSSQDEGQLNSRMRIEIDKRLKQELFSSVLEFTGQ